MTRERSPKKKIEEALLKAQLIHKKLTWTELLESSSLSKGALSKHLNEMLKNGNIESNIEFNAQGQRQTVYTLAKITTDEMKRKLVKPLTADVHTLSPQEFDYVINQLQLLAFSAGLNIKALEDRKQADSLMRDYLDFNLDTIATYIPEFVAFARAYSIGFAKAKGGMSPKKQYELFVKKLNEDYIKKIINPWIEAIAFTIYMNQDITSKNKNNHNSLGEYIEQRGKAIDMSFLDEIERIIELNKTKTPDNKKA